MKTVPLAAVLLRFAALGVLHISLGAAEVEERDSSKSDELVPFVPRRIKLGMTESEVVTSMHGKPDRTVSSDIWIYWNFKGTKRPSELIDPTLLIFFKAGRVASIRFSDAALVRHTLAKHDTILLKSASKHGSIR
jgi:hypothetical protein